MKENYGNENVMHFAQSVDRQLLWKNIIALIYKTFRAKVCILKQLILKMFVLPNHFKAMTLVHTIVAHQASIDAHFTRLKTNSQMAMKVQSQRGHDLE